MKYFIIILSIFIILLTIGYVFNKNEMQKNELVIYELKRNDFYEFVKNPSIDFLNKIKYSSYLFNESSDINKLSVKYNSDKETTEQIFDNKQFWVNRVCISQKLIDFLSNKSSLERYLSQNDINSKIENYTTVYSYGLPTTLYITTKNEDYFITINENHGDMSSTSDDYIYNLYSSIQYSKKFLPKSAKLVVQTQYKKQECDILIHNDYGEIPFLFTMEALGANIFWKDQNKALISLNEHSFELDISKETLVDVENNKNHLTAIPGENSSWYINNNELFIDDWTFQIFIKQFGWILNKNDLIYTLENSI